MSVPSCVSCETVEILSCSCQKTAVISTTTPYSLGCFCFWFLIHIVLFVFFREKWEGIWWSRNNNWKFLLSSYPATNTGLSGHCMFSNLYSNSAKCKCHYYLHFMKTRKFIFLRRNSRKLNDMPKGTQPISEIQSSNLLLQKHLTAVTWMVTDKVV